MSYLSLIDNVRKIAQPFLLKGMGVVEAAQERVFKAADVDGDGALSAEEVGGIGGGRGKSDPAVIAALDADGDGKFSFAEAKASKLFSREGLDVLLAAQGGAAGYLFAEADADGDGKLTGEEFRAVGPQGDFTAPGVGSDEPELQILSKADRAFFQADADEDGALSPDELNALVAHAAVLRPVFFQVNAAQAAETLIAAADADGSGGLSAAEAQAAAGARPVDVGALFQGVEGGADGELSLDDMKAAIAQQADFYRTGVSRLGDEIGGGDNTLLQLLRQSTDRVVGDYLDRWRDVSIKA